MNLDIDITTFLNGFIVGNSNSLSDRLLETFFNNQSFIHSGLLIAIIAGLWFSTKCRANRGRLIIGVCAASLAALVSRLLQNSVAFHRRPILSMHLNLPAGVHPDISHERLSSFPSDHATLVFGLCTVIFVTNKRLGLISCAWLMVICAARVALGAHWPSDILGGFGLGVLAVKLSEWIPCPEWVTRVEERHSALFYAVITMVAYEISTFFIDVTDVLGSFSHIK
jgi:membrane-associated phospholipid phosphatase